jgi:LmbE family N-acetylglucosaminyl deacetylase
VELGPACYEDTVISFSLQGVRRILCLGAHSDDIEIGCGGTILRLQELSKNLEFYWIIFCSSAERAKEARKSAAWFLRNGRCKEIVVKSFRDGFLPYSGGEVKDCFEELKATFKPDIIFTHCRHDLHQDHRLLCELTWNTFRNHLILEYEIPKYDADLQSPNVFVSLSKSICAAKVKALMRHFGTQRNKHWFSEDLFNGLLRLRGVESASPSGFAEGFYCRKMLLDL